ncbi:MAG: hypothetical protein ACK415_11410 [Thermodesulfovibrionales bacterium]
MPSREAFIYIPGLLKTIFYIVSLISSIVFITGLYSRFSIWLKGNEESSDLLSGKGFGGMVIMSLRYFFSRDCLLATRVMSKSRFRGIMLIFIYWGFTILFIGTILVGLDHYLKLGFLRGTFYLLFSFMLDLSGLAVLTGSVFFILRRTIVSRDIVSGWDDLPVLILLSLIILSGFSVEGVRLSIMSPSFMDLSPIGALFARLLRKVSSPHVYILLWSIHVIAALFFIAFIPFSKQFHMFAAQITTQDAMFRKERLGGLVHDR